MFKRVWKRSGGNLEKLFFFYVQGHALCIVGIKLCQMYEQMSLYMNWNINFDKFK